MWGGVGRGKTFLMDLFYADVQDKVVVRRQHFHRFMYWVHEQLRLRKGSRNPLQSVAEALSDEIQVLCFDEFFVSEIGDAMILGRLMEPLLQRGVALVATSNIPPERLYWKGLHRDRFLPTIELIQRHLQTVEVNGEQDYRLRELVRIRTFHHPLDDNSHHALEQAYRELSGAESGPSGPIIIQGREIPVVSCSPKVLWLTFDTACRGPRAASDYIEMARLYPSLLVGEVPQLSDRDNDAARRFITLIDELYERQVKLFMSCAVPVDDLYVGRDLAFEFRRCLSRLREMESEAYLAKPHVP